MKKALLIAAAIMFVASSAFALPDHGYIGMFKDMTHNTSPAANTVCPATYGQFHGYIMILPSVNGLQAAEFAVSFPPTVVTLVTTKNPGITVELGNLPGGMSVAFGEGMCQTDWVMIYDLQLMFLGGAQLKIDIIPHPGTLPLPAMQFANCLPGYPIEPLTYLTPLYLCWTPDPGPLGVQQTNWGAIKSLF
jgi:hypothetical protein